MATIKYKQDEQGNKKVIINGFDGVQKASCMCCNQCEGAFEYDSINFNNIPVLAFLPDENGRYNCYYYVKMTTSGGSFLKNGDSSLKHYEAATYIWGPGGSSATGSITFTRTYRGAGGVLITETETESPDPYNMVTPDLYSISDVTITSPTTKIFSFLSDDNCGPANGDGYQCVYDYVVRYDLYNEIPE